MYFVVSIALCIDLLLIKVTKNAEFSLILEKYNYV